MTVDELKALRSACSYMQGAQRTMNQAIIWWEEALKLIEAALAEKPPDVAKGETCGTCCHCQSLPINTFKSQLFCLCKPQPRQRNLPMVEKGYSACDYWEPIPQPEKEPSSQVSDEETNQAP
jgi:hypothetical protein